MKAVKVFREPGGRQSANTAARCRKYELSFLKKGVFQNYGRRISLDIFSNFPRMRNVPQAAGPRIHRPRIYLVRSTVLVRVPFQCEMDYLQSFSAETSYGYEIFLYLAHCHTRGSRPGFTFIWSTCMYERTYISYVRAQNNLM